MNSRMSKTRQSPLASRFAAVAAVAAAVVLSPAPAAAQNALLLVNGEPITAFDIEQRTKFHTLVSRDHKAPPRQQVIDELIDEKLKVQVGKRYLLEIPDKDVDTAYGEMAKRMSMNGDQLTKVLGAQGIGPETLKNRIRADIVWTQIVRGRFQQSLQVREKDVLEAMESKKGGPPGAAGAAGTPGTPGTPGADNAATANYEYRLTPILFVVPRGSGTPIVEGRTREAEALRSRFQGCDEGLPFAKAIRDVAVRNPITKTSADLPPALRDILDKTPVGKLTAPEVTQNGVEVFALCSKKETNADSSAKRQAREEIFSKQFQSKASRYLAELRKAAMIEHPK
jgi:peptidyl-prolyl cis-trans isomerase SurA